MSDSWIVLARERGAIVVIMMLAAVAFILYINWAPKQSAPPRRIYECMHVQRWIKNSNFLRVENCMGFWVFVFPGFLNHMHQLNSTRGWESYANTQGKKIYILVAFPLFNPKIADWVQLTKSIQISHQGMPVAAN